MSRAGTIINISGATPVDDPEYRYKMPTVYGKIEGRGNGIKTVIPNISEVALSLHRPPGEVNKFFGCELGAQTTYNADTDRAVVNGAHTDSVLQNMVHRYIEGFVLCPNCRLPETDYKIKSDTIYHKCAACGAKEMLNMQHKLCTYILAQDKKAKKDAKSKDKKKKGDKEAGKEEKKKSKKDKAEGSDEEKKEKKDKKKKDKKDKKDKDKKKDKKDKKKKKKDDDSNDDDELAGATDDLSLGSDNELDDGNAMALAVEGTKKFLKENPDASVDDIVECVVNQQMASALKSYDKVHIFVQSAITINFFKEKQVEKYAPAISKITQSNPMMERHLIAALEAVCVEKPKNFPVLIKQLYDEDALEEEVILQWAEEGRNEYTLDAVDEDSRAALRGEAEPLVIWLQEEEDSSDSDSD
uniref:W2 domain-containing protein n=1 Tax=Ditylum brightwellii TaxID=49249 RepID=A0A6V2MCK3_9STRA|mmetsp:Transcript_11317/g.15103  ORF Transcript_11317/g.15103 Transcript_11317/m.15103 type:complete len:413 (-) Transcript_11317:229-1467(-)